MSKNGNTIKPVALVTGASSGIGKALVIELLSKNYDVIALARSLEKLEELKKSHFDKTLLIYRCDVSCEEDVKNVSDEIKKLELTPSFFYLNAGIVGPEAMESLENFDIEIHRKMFSVNYFGVLHFIQQWLELCRCKKEKATFIVSSSINAIFAPPGGSAYAASKAAIVKAFDGFRLAYAAENIKFLSVFCGPVDTPGLVGKLPFTWTAKKMARYMIKRALKGKSHSNPSSFYTLLSVVLNKLSEKKVLMILKLLSGQKN